MTSMFSASVRKNRAQKKPAVVPSKKKHTRSVSLAAAILGQAQSEQAMLSNLSLVDARQQQITMGRKIRDVVAQHKLSAPLAKVILAVPNVAEAIQNFPDPQMLNIIPESARSPQQHMGMEALDTMVSDGGSDAKSDLGQSADAYTAMFDRLDDFISKVSGDAQELRQALTGAAIPISAFAETTASVMSADAETAALNLLIENTSDFPGIDVSELRSNPDAMGDEVDGLSQLVSSVGPLLGLSMGGDGIVIDPSAISEEYVPTVGTLSSKGYDTDVLVNQLDLAIALIGNLQTILSRRDDLEAAMRDAATDVPDVTAESTTDESGAVVSVYSIEDHLCVVKCYLIYFTMLVSRSVSEITNVVGLADTVIGEGDGGAA